MTKKIVSLGVLALTVGCSNGGGGGGSSSDSGNVSSKMTAPATQAFGGQTALFESSRGVAQPSAAEKSVLGLASKAFQAKSANLTKVSAAQKAIQSSACKMEWLEKPGSNSGNEGAALPFQPMKFKISGPTCPVEISMQMTIAGVASAKPCQEAQGIMNCDFKASVKMSYRVLDAKLSRELEVSSGHANMMFEMTQTMPAGSGSSGHPANNSGNMSMKGKGQFDLKAVDLNGQAHLISGSQDVNMKMTMPTGSPNSGSAPMPQMFGGMKEDLQYLEESSGITSVFNSTIAFNGSGQPDERYYIDGISVTSANYNSERQKFSNSMMAFGKEEESSTSPTQPGPNPNPNPGPGPGPQPTPPPSANPTPNPTPTPVQPTPNPVPSEGGKWICVIENHTSHDLFAGFGSVEFVAKSKAEQACRASAHGNSCSSLSQCEEQEIIPNAWYCQTKNYSTGRVFGGEGASKTEAAYRAKKECFVASPDSASSCASVGNSDCARQ